MWWHESEYDVLIAYLRQKGYFNTKILLKKSKRLVDMVSSLITLRWFPRGTPVSSTNDKKLRR